MSVRRSINKDILEENGDTSNSSSSRSKIAKGTGNDISRLSFWKSKLGNDNSNSSSSQIFSLRDVSSRDGCGHQIKPHVGRKDMPSYRLSDKNVRIAGQRRIKELGNSFQRNTFQANTDTDNDAITNFANTATNGGSMEKRTMIQPEETKKLLQTKEETARSTAESRICCVFLSDGIAAFLVILKYLVTIESVVSTCLSTGTTLLLYYYHADWDQRGNSSNEKPASYGRSMSFLILSFFLVMPITTLLRITYLRREQNLQHLGKLKACAMAIYQCHATWMWKTKEGDGQPQLNRLEHSDECLRLLIDFADTLTRFLTLPMTGYPRHREIKRGRREEETTIAAAYALFETAISDYGTKLGLLTETMKEHGFSPSEASRVRQSERMLLEEAEYLREGKLYRTPQSMNALIVVFAVFGPSFYAPAFCQIGYDFGSVWFGIVYAAIISLSLNALYEAVKLMEDPFVCYITIDGIDVYEELSIVYYLQLLRARSTIFPNAPDFGICAAAATTTSAGMGDGDNSRQFRRSSVSTTRRRSSTRFSAEDMALVLSSPITQRRSDNLRTNDDIESGPIILDQGEASEEIEFLEK